MIKHVLLAILLIWLLFVRLLAEAVFDQLSLPSDVQGGGGGGGDDTPLRFLFDIFKSVYCL